MHLLLRRQQVATEVHLLQEENLCRWPAIVVALRTSAWTGARRLVDSAKDDAELTEIGPVAGLRAEANVLLVLNLRDEAGWRLIVFETLGRENNLVDVLLVVHFQEALVVDDEHVDGLGEAEDQAEDFRAAVELLHKAIDDASISEPALQKLCRHERVIELPRVVLNDGIEADRWRLRILLHVNLHLCIGLLFLELVALPVVLLQRELLNEEGFEHLLLLELAEVFSGSGVRVIGVKLVIPFVLPDLLLAEPIDLPHVELLPLILVFLVQLLLDSLDEGVEEAEKHDEETEVRKVGLTVRPRKDVLKEDANLHSVCPIYQLFIYYNQIFADAV